jgi:hypothetical protein
MNGQLEPPEPILKFLNTERLKTVSNKFSRESFSEIKQAVTCEGYHVQKLK